MAAPRRKDGYGPGPGSVSIPSGRTSATTAAPSSRRTKKSGPCRRARPARHASAAETAATTPRGRPGGSPSTSGGLAPATTRTRHEFRSSRSATSPRSSADPSRNGRAEPAAPPRTARPSTPHAGFRMTGRACASLAAMRSALEQRLLDRSKSARLPSGRPREEAAIQRLLARIAAEAPAGSCCPSLSRSGAPPGRTPSRPGTDRDVMLGEASGACRSSAAQWPPAPAARRCPAASPARPARPPACVTAAKVRGSRRTPAPSAAAGAVASCAPARPV
jgi:hypothetical protein